ncbi:MAG: UDP-N-acetylglucosamine--N-acetylmuramyl-(pentapeptide) pyrophosphoryl-undecaprenol N-acetylglucosamine transferase, partial [Proteobacteria bacterium]|nr:UDP-N-acetylglucosamine--N-acetylmuramyl-(pentapeptide) pyrophosphoryl-undecaprenol N-acetylglucosamine transferase [Pseudomonadota bacterium]
PGGKTVLTGNPVREAILTLARKVKKKKEGPLTLLVLGGSLGAHRVNELVTGAFALGLQGLQGVRVIHQTGPGDVAMVEASYRNSKTEATVSPFFRDMAAVYEEADLLVSRAGATTLAELAVLGKPVLLIPYPYAADQHQEKNAEFYVQGGGAVMFVEKDLTAELLAKNLARLLGDRQGLEKMGAAIRSRAFPEATEHIVDVCMDLLRQKVKRAGSASRDE